MLYLLIRAQGKMGQGREIIQPCGQPASLHPSREKMQKSTDFPRGGGGRVGRRTAAAVLAGSLVGFRITWELVQAR